MKKKWIMLGVLAGAIILAGWLGWTAERKPAGGTFVKVDLAKSFNARLTDTIHCPDSLRNNDLSELPTGAQTFAGVPFQVQGAIQLWGRGLDKYKREGYPKEVLNVAVGKRCAKFHLLHGAGFYDGDGTPVAKLILHYADRTERDLDLKTGEHLRDWWGSPSQRMKDSGTAVAWFGQNPYMRKMGPVSEHSIRIYRTTIPNPNPSSELVSFDYVSLSGNSAPFLLGMTLEE